MDKSRLMEGLCLETIARNGNYFEGSAHLLYLRSFRVMCGYALLQGKITTGARWEFKNNSY